MSLLSERPLLLVYGADYVGALRYEHGAASPANLVDRRLDRSGIIGAAVALGSLVLDID